MSVTGARAVGYRRVSTAEQSESGLGLAAQLATIEVMAARLNLPLIAVHEDAGLSGALPLEQRPGLLAAIDMLRTNDVLICARRDRLGRDVVHVAMIEKLVQRRGARVVTPDAPDDDSPTSVLLKTLLDAFSQFERQIIKQRTKSAMAVARAKNQRVGRIPFGKQLAADGRHLEENPSELALLDRIRWLRIRGFTLEDIATDLNQAGFANRQGRPWKPSFIGQLLERHGDGIGGKLAAAQIA